MDPFCGWGRGLSFPHHPFSPKALAQKRCHKASPKVSLLNMRSANKGREHFDPPCRSCVWHATHNREVALVPNILCSKYFRGLLDAMLDAFLFTDFNFAIWLNWPKNFGNGFWRTSFAICVTMHVSEPSRCEASALRTWYIWGSNASLVGAFVTIVPIVHSAFPLIDWLIHWFGRSCCIKLRKSLLSTLNSKVQQWQNHVPKDWPEYITVFNVSISHLS